MARDVMATGRTQQEPTATVVPAPTIGHREEEHRHRLPVRVHAPRGRWELRLGRIFRYLPFIGYLGLSVTTRRTRGTWLGYLWIPLRPALNLLAKGLVFGGMLHVQAGDRPYLIFLMAGQGAWDFFDKAVYWSFRTLQSERKLISSYQVPWVGAIAATVIPAAVDAAQYLVIGGIACVYYKLTQGSFFVDFGIHTIESLVGLILLALWAIGISLVVAPLVTKIRDLRYVLKYVLGFWLYLVPIVYPISYLPPKYRGIAEYDPITAPIELIKDGVLSSGRPSTVSLMTCMIGLLVIFPIGLLTTMSAERNAHAKI
jgi:lipopolysaccharide transport system permease protein